MISSQVTLGQGWTVRSWDISQRRAGGTQALGGGPGRCGLKAWMLCGLGDVLPVAGTCVTGCSGCRERSLPPARHMGSWCDSRLHLHSLRWQEWLYGTIAQCGPICSG